MLYEIPISTKERLQIIDITDEVQKMVYKSKVKHGIAVVFTHHTTTGLMINEYESGLIEDFKAKMKELIPKCRLLPRQDRQQRPRPPQGFPAPEPGGRHTHRPGRTPAGNLAEDSFRRA